MLKAFRFRIYPSECQKQWLIRNFGCVRFTYNHLLHARQVSYKKTGVIDYTLTPASLKKEYLFLKEADSLALANAQLNLDRAFRNYFKGRAGFPKLKSKKNMWQSYTTNNQSHTIYLKGDRLKLPKQKELFKVELHRPVEGKIRSATISARYNEQFYVSLLCEVLPVDRTGSNKRIEIAYDPEKLVKTSFPVQLPVPPFNQTAKRLEIAKRKLVIKGKSAQQRKEPVYRAKNYQKQKRKVMDLYLKQKCQKEDYLEKISGLFIREYDYLLVEETPVHLASAEFSLHDWHKLLMKLQYKAKWYNKTVCLIDQKDFSSHLLERSQKREQIGRLSGF
ncbi:RNA-guided endonuclease TnpB family protein [Enterococcus sp. ZJ1622]|uniref:RNA-guided endonuclease TnpB family protein n=1 Tax=Enterococcus sp. ZJ1622 TaxID=2709401 RepID=UPI0013ECAF03|nr:RNA-guided endonuclease TnpB family protein [Enterococcus sp. ZJ1622]